MRKILFLFCTSNVGGAEKLKLTLLNRIDRNRYDIKALFIGTKGYLGEKIEELGYRVGELRQNPSSKNIFITHKLVKYLKKERPDILHTCLFNANFHGRIAGLVARIPCIITEEHGEHKEYKGIKFFPYILADFLLSRLNCFIICCSERLKRDIIKKERLPRNKVISIENCLDIDAYRIKTDRIGIRKKYGIFEEIVFIAVASLKRGKGHDLLINVFKEVKEMGCHFKCFFAGDGPLKEALHEKCRELGLLEEVIFLGNIDGIADYLNASDVFILPSFSEGLSIALMEAMLIGLPSIVTNVGSNPDLIKTGFNGTVVLPGDREGLKNALIFYLRDRLVIGEFGARSKAIIERRYSFIGKYLGHYYELWDKCGKKIR